MGDQVLGLRRFWTRAGNIFLQVRRTPLIIFRGCKKLFTLTISAWHMINSLAICIGTSFSLIYLKQLEDCEWFERKMSNEKGTVRNVYSNCTSNCKFP